MTNEQMERAIEFLLDHHAKFSTELDGLKEAVAGLVQSTSALERQAESDRQEIREAIENLIVANEVTRKLAEDVARLEVQTSQRVTSHDKQIAELAEQGKETDTRLNTLISIVERHITNPDAHKTDQ